MAELMAVTFEEHGALHYLDPDGVEYAVGDWVLYPTDDGPVVARCVWAPRRSAGSRTAVPVCLGRASEDDVRRDAEHRRQRVRIRDVAGALIARHGLPMKIVGTDFVSRPTEGVDRLSVVYFTAPGRVDFRTLVGELARALGSRVDLRQVSPRDAARMSGSLGNCGRDLCCANFLPDDPPVTSRHATDQGLAANPLQIAGACGRLLCCLAFEHPLYADFRSRAPAVGATVLTDEGPGRVVSHAALKDAVTVRTAGGVVTCPLLALRSVRQQPVQAEGPS